MEHPKDAPLKGRLLWPYSQHFIFFVTYEWANKLKCYIRKGWKGLPGKNTLAYRPFCELWLKWSVMGQCLETFYGRKLWLLNKLGWKGLPGTNTNLLRKVVTYARKKFYIIGHWCYPEIGNSGIRIGINYSVLNKTNFQIVRSQLFTDMLLLIYIWSTSNIYWFICIQICCQQIQTNSYSVTFNYL